MATRSLALSPAVRHSTDPRAARKQTIGRALIALVWAIGDIGQVVVGRSGGVGTRSGDAPFVVFGVSAVLGAALLCGLAVVNVRAVRTAGPRLAGLQTAARVIGWLCALRLVAVVAVLVAQRASGGAHDTVLQTTFLGVVVLAVLDAAVAVGIAGATVGALRRLLQPAAPPR